MIRTCCLEYLDAMFHAPLLLVSLVSRKMFWELQNDEEISVSINTAIVGNVKNALQIKILINIPSSTDDNRCIKSFSCGLILSFAIDCFLSLTFLRSSSPSSSLSLNSSPTCVFSFGGRLPPVAFSASLNAWKWILCVNR